MTFKLLALLGALSIFNSTYAETVSNAEDSFSQRESTVQIKMAPTEVRDWAVRQGRASYPGLTDDGRDCEFNIYITKTDLGKSIYISLGQRLSKNIALTYVGGFLESTSTVTGQSYAGGAIDSQNTYIEFVGKDADDRNSSQQEVRVKLILERGPKGNGVMKATGRSSLDGKDVVCTFVALVS